MASAERNKGYPWSGRELQQLTELASKKVGVGLIAYMLGRSPNAIRFKAGQMGLPLKERNMLFRGRTTRIIAFNPRRTR